MFAESITGVSIPDLNSGLRVFRRELAERYFDLLPDRFSFTTTITVAAITDGCAVHFAPIEYLPRVGRSKLRPIGDTLRIGRQLIGREREVLLDLGLERNVQRGAHSDTPAARSAARNAASCFASIGTSGRRR